MVGGGRWGGEGGGEGGGSQSDGLGRVVWVYKIGLK